MSTMRVKEAAVKAGRVQKDVAAERGVSQSGWERAESINVDLSLVVPHSKNIRHEVLRDEGFEALCRSIERDGLYQPLLVTDHPVQAGHFLLLAGHRRLEALKQMSFTHAPAMLRRGIHSPAEQAGAMLKENTLREPLTKGEEADAVDLLSELGMSVKDIQELSGHSATWVSARRRLKAAPESVIDAVSQGRATLERALEVVEAGSVHPDDEKILAEAIHLPPADWKIAHDRVDRTREFRESIPELKRAMGEAGLKILEPSELTINTDGTVGPPAGYRRQWHLDTPGWTGVSSLTPSSKDQFEWMAQKSWVAVVTADPAFHAGPPTILAYSHVKETTKPTKGTKDGAVALSPEEELEMLERLHSDNEAAEREQSEYRAAFDLSVRVRSELIEQRMKKAQPFTKAQAKAALIEGLSLLARNGLLAAREGTPERVELWNASTGWDLEAVTSETVRARAQDDDVSTLSVALVNIVMQQQSPWGTPGSFGLRFSDMSHEDKTGSSLSTDLIRASESIYGPDLTPDDTLVKAPQRAPILVKKAAEASSAFSIAAVKSSFGGASKVIEALTAQTQGDEE